MLMLWCLSPYWLPMTPVDRELVKFALWWHHERVTHRCNQGGSDWWMPTLPLPWLALGGPCPSFACKCGHIVWSDNGLVWRRPELPISQIGLDRRALKIGLFWLVSMPSGGLGTTPVPPQSNTSVSVSYCQPVLAQFLLPCYPSCYEPNTSRQCINM